MSNPLLHRAVAVTGRVYLYLAHTRFAAWLEHVIR
jgi:hypothetical protein